MGKAIDKRLAELGGKRILKLGTADEAIGLEEQVETWMNNYFKFLDAKLSKDNNNSDMINNCRSLFKSQILEQGIYIFCNLLS